MGFEVNYEEIGIEFKNQSSTEYCLHCLIHIHTIQAEM